ncbi:D-2-hydroxyacid dehydrogenase [Ktedonosporobacter rubrisoli]|uniref:D-2-hydroxyacid dehydrogenase n=1 Tax=Ktedonosporobacter rubrisoli TaxID=2509675 RepID=A0A4V0Z017_KTERU|nr:D-2-hydroxyacid dehydrogenase [Ktedonosporobacter rubrisoli]QBD81661.1 D-2-hydroxyacid dehydrogenase [Ktedonosporobacter rubrisoli]
MYPKIVSTFHFSEESLKLLEKAAEADIVNCASLTDEKVQPLAHEAEIICAPTLPANWHELFPRLRWLQSSAAGTNHLPASLVTSKSGIIVTTASGVHAHNIAEYVICSMLMFNRSWPQLVEAQRQHKWLHRSYQGGSFSSRELIGRSIGIVGLGHIGRRIAQLARAFGMRVLATRFSAKEDGQDADVDQLFAWQHLHELLKQSDYVVLSVPLTKETTKLISEPELQAMRNDAYLVNIARGNVIDEPALIRALQEGQIGGAGLDVTAQEPLPADSPLYELPNVILTPHLSGHTEHYDQRLAAIFADNLRRYRSGEHLTNQYNASRGY